MKPLTSSPVSACDTVEQGLKELTLLCLRRKKPLPFGRHPKDPWAEWFLDMNRADARAEFIDVWEKIRCALGTDPLEHAADRARGKRLALPAEMRQRRPIDDDLMSETDYRFFLSLAWHLQHLMGEKNILLPCEKVGAVMGVSKMTISRYCRYAFKDKLLHPMQRGTRGGPGRADQWRFAVDRVTTFHTVTPEST